MPAVRPFSADLADTHTQVSLALGDALMVAPAVVLNIMASGQVRVETSVAGLSAAV